VSSRFLFSGQELTTAVHQQVDVVAVVFNDNAYGAYGVKLRRPDELGRAVA
jgi:thiamine pyrophosphate-dependent acetolactate synthase large subunit-like protein